MSLGNSAAFEAMQLREPDVQILRDEFKKYFQRMPAERRLRLIGQLEQILKELKGETQ